MQRVDGRDQRLLGFRPAGGVGIAQHGGADLFVGQMRGRREGRDMHAPFIFAAGARAGAVDDDLALAQATSGPRSSRLPARNFSQARGMAGHDAEQQQRRRAAHDAVELRLDLGRIRRLQAARCA